MLKRFKHGVAITAALFLGIAGQAAATPLIDFTDDDSPSPFFGNSFGCVSGCTLGYIFSVFGSVTVDGLGVYDADSDGLTNAHQVGLWEDSGGALLASGSVGPGSPAGDLSASGDGTFRYTNITALTLTTGVYTVGVQYQLGDTDHVVFNAVGIFGNDPAASYSGLRLINSAVFQRPTLGDITFDRYFGPTLHLVEDQAVPEPSTIFLLGTGLVGLMRYARRRGR